MEYSRMNLHHDPEAFAEFSSAAAEEFGLPEVYVEKDYWVTFALQNLAESNLVDQVVFKGGTSLSKAYRLIDRFSEDIDLAVLNAPVSDAACKALLKKVEPWVHRCSHLQGFQIPENGLPIPPPNFGTGIRASLARGLD